MDLSTALNLFMRQAVIQQKFPCSLELELLDDIKVYYQLEFFALFGKGNGLGFDEEPKELPIRLVEEL